MYLIAVLPDYKIISFLPRMSVMTDLKKLTAPRGILNLTLGKAQESFEPILKHLKISQEDSENPTLLEQMHSYLDHSSWRSDSIA
ncbi:unnamed protein product [Timema podura]|uniref:Uncharacterized protein n=1 Tax=Timema podura TaxID=61482 RepID=A0ABN7NK73_TIMPD|nr:unnamed protein product [Timema podura]